MSDSSGEWTPPTRDEPLLDTLLRDALPEIKLALGDLIDQENRRAMPDRYSRLLPGSTLRVALRPDALDALAPVRAEVERELTESCSRHGSLYDRTYHVRVRAAERPGAPLFAVGTESAPPAEHTEMAADAAVPPSPAPSFAPPPERFPVTDPDATRIDVGVPSGWEADRWELVVEEEGEGGQGHSSTHPLREPVCTVGRESSAADLDLTVALADSPHVSRRQLALVWQPRGDEPGFRVYNLGLNPLHFGEREVPGARAPHGQLGFAAIDPTHPAWVAQDEAVRIGSSGPTLRVREASAPAPDPDATVLE
ncbi:hypothetical protein BH20GEM2_BH20GEM2_08210 [soil metagenome]